MSQNKKPWVTSEEITSLFRKQITRPPTTNMARAGRGNSPEVPWCTKTHAYKIGRSLDDDSHKKEFIDSLCNK